MTNPFSSFFGSFNKKSGSVIGIDIGSSAIKVVQLRKQGARAVLETYGELALGPYTKSEVGQATNLPPDKIIEALKDILKESNTTTKGAAISIAAGASLLLFIKMPNVGERELQTMIPIEARKYIPVPISEVSLDWWVIPKEEVSVSDFESQDASKAPEEKGVEVLLVVIHNETIARVKEIGTGAGIDLSFFEIEVFSSMRAVVEQSLDSVMIFDMGAGSTKLYVIERGILRSAHTINRGSQEITLALSRSLGLSVADAERYKRTTGLSADMKDKNANDIITLTLDYIFSETNRVIFNYQKKYGKNVSRVILVGGGSLLKGFLELARNRFETEVILGDPFNKVIAPAFLEQTLRGAGPEFAVAIGLALRELQEVR
jgi:type IV pilus assembly protein PilM